MIKMNLIKDRLLLISAVFVTIFCFLSGCNSTSAPPASVQGYVEGDFVYIAAPLLGRLEKLLVQRGDQVKAGEPLFGLENVQEKTARDETKQRLAQLRAQTADARKGRRPTEIDSLRAQLLETKSALQLSERELLRQERLLAASVVSAQEVDRLRSRREQDRQRVAALEAEIGTAKLGIRNDQIAALEAGIRAMEATLARSEWDIAQKRQNSPQTGVVFDTLYHPGEWIAAGRPVIVLLPPLNIKVRLFVAQPLLAAIHQGDKVQVTVDGESQPFNGIVRFISPQAEYTPPVIYSKESRQKLVYMVELGFDQAAAARLHPGQPVTAKIGAGK